jgi:hypothetical protein
MAESVIGRCHLFQVITESFQRASLAAFLLHKGPLPLRDYVYLSVFVLQTSCGAVGTTLSIVSFPSLMSIPFLFPLSLLS